MRKTGIWTGTDDELTATSTNIALVATCWLNFDAIQISESAEETDLAPAIYQVMSLVAPFLRDEERSQLQSMAEQYR